LANCLKTAGYTSNCFTINKVRRQSLEFIFTERAKNDELQRMWYNTSWSSFEIVRVASDQFGRRDL